MSLQQQNLAASSAKWLFGRAPLQTCREQWRTWHDMTMITAEHEKDHFSLFFPSTLIMKQSYVLPKLQSFSLDYPLNRFPDYAQIWAFFCLWVVCIKINPHNCSTSPLPPTKIWIQNGVAQYLLLKTSQIELNIGVLRLQQLCLKVRVGLTDPRATAPSSSPPDSEKQQQSSTLWTNLNLLLPVDNAYFSTLHKLKLSGTTKLTK